MEDAYLGTGSVSSLDQITIFTLEHLLNGKFSVEDLEKALSDMHDGGNIQFAVILSEPTDVHLSHAIPAQSFESHQAATMAYLSNAKEILSAESSANWVDKSIREKIISTLGEPPKPAQPIYFISAEKVGKKNLVYVGKTAGKDGRFVGGHLAISKLHAPEYDGDQKKVYMASALARITETEWLSLELINPGFRATFYLSEIEWNLINELQPILNSDGKTLLRAEVPHPVFVHDLHGLVESTSRVWSVNGGDNRKV